MSLSPDSDLFRSEPVYNDDDEKDSSDSKDDTENKDDNETEVKDMVEERPKEEDTDGTTDAKDPAADGVLIDWEAIAKELKAEVTRLKDDAKAKPKKKKTVTKTKRKTKKKDEDEPSPRMVFVRPEYYPTHPPPLPPPHHMRMRPYYEPEDFMRYS